MLFIYTQILTKMKSIFVVLLFISFNMMGVYAQSARVSSPDGVIQVTFALNSRGVPEFSVKHGDSLVIMPSVLGLRLGEADFSGNLRLAKIGNIESVRDDYSLLNDKRSQNSYRANRIRMTFEALNGISLSIVFQVSNDGVAFRYELEGSDSGVKHILAENSSFCFPLSSKAWLHPHAVAQSGWANSQPSYEEYYKMGVPVGTPSALGQGWSFPALFLSAGHWVLLSEANMSRNYCGSHLGDLSPNGTYSIAFAQTPERTTPDAALLPESTLPWQSPWRLIIVGQSLATIVESTLTTDVSSPSVIKDVSFVKPGKSSWSWVLLKDGATVFDVQKRFIDYASEMKWRYCLIDALWDTQIGYEKIQELVDYAKTKNVDIILWYNSGGNWNKTPQTPTHILFDVTSRRKEFARLKQMGVKGLKVDFFGGDGQSFMAYYQDLMEDAAVAGLAINFHGATIPRGWNRAYPNLVAMESIRGFEFITFEQANTNEQPTHCAVLPFTRNAVGPMDFTPVCFSEIPKLKRITSNGFELALSVLFQSGVQHYAETPDGMQKQPAYVVEFLKNLPSQWEDVKFLDGYPGEFAVLARKANGKWFMAGINGRDTDLPVTLNLSALGAVKGGTIITDGGNNRLFSTRTFTGSTLRITIKSFGGFVAEIY